MTIQEAKQAQAALDAALAETLNAFSAATGLTVNSLQFDVVLHMGGPTRYVVATEVKL